MGDLEVVVRPMVFPNIRPTVARILPPKDHPEKGVTVITGGGGGPIDLTFSWSMSYSTQAPVMEVRRQFDKQRVYQVDEKGKINKKNYVDIERLSRVRLNDSVAEAVLGNPAVRVLYAEPPKVDNVEILERDVTRDAS